MGDEQGGEVMRAWRSADEIDDLRPGCGYRAPLWARRHDEIRLGRQRAGDADALLLAGRQLGG